MNHLRKMMLKCKKKVCASGLLLFVVSMFFSGCDKFEGNQEIPSYIRIDSLVFTTDFTSQGTAAHKMVDAWVYVNDQLIGGFELPAEFPVLQEGDCRLEIRAGIKLNGISDTRAPYPCIAPYKISSILLEPANSISLTPTFEYFSNTEFVWREELEDASLALREGNKSDTGIYRTQPENFPGAYLDEYSQYSGIAYLDDERSVLELETDNGDGEGFVFDRGDFVFLEAQFKTTVPILVGMYIRRTSVGGVEDRPFIVLNTSDDWNKIYINFTPIVNEVADAVNFKIYFLATKQEGEADHEIMFDNLKLITRPNL
jgi:hypothetical protein